MERAWLHVKEGVVRTASTRLIAVTWSWLYGWSMGGGMGGEGRGDQVESWGWRIEGKGQKSSRVAQRSRPGYAREI